MPWQDSKGLNSLNFFSTDFVASCEKKHNLLSFSSFCDLLEKCDSAK